MKKLVPFGQENNANNGEYTYIYVFGRTIRWNVQVQPVIPCIDFHVKCKSV